MNNADMASVLREVADCWVIRTGHPHGFAQTLRARADELDAQKMPGTLDIPGVKDYVNATPPSLDPRLASAPSNEGAGGSGPAAGLCQNCDGTGFLNGLHCRCRACDGTGKSAPATDAALDETPPVQFKTCPNCKAYTDLSAHACRREGGVCTISDIDEARGAAGPEVECKHGPWPDELRRMYASACYDGVGQDFLTIISHINQQAERIAELDKCNTENWLMYCKAADERDALRAKVERLKAWRTWGKNVALPALVSGYWKRIDAALASAPKDAENGRGEQ